MDRGYDVPEEVADLYSHGIGKINATFSAFLCVLTGFLMAGMYLTYHQSAVNYHQAKVNQRISQQLLNGKIDYETLGISIEPPGTPVALTVCVILVGICWLSSGYLIYLTWFVPCFKEYESHTRDYVDPTEGW